MNRLKNAIKTMGNRTKMLVLLFLSWHSVKCAEFPNLVQSPSTEAIRVQVIKQENEARKLSTIITNFVFFFFCFSPWRVGHAIFEAKHAETIVCWTQWEWRIIKIPVVKNLRIHWMQKAIAEDTGINYHRFVRFLHASANFKRMNEQKKRKRTKESSCVLSLQIQNVL